MTLTKAQRTITVNLSPDGLWNWFDGGYTSENDASADIHRLSANLAASIQSSFPSATVVINTRSEEPRRIEFDPADYDADARDAEAIEVLIDRAFEATHNW